MANTQVILFLINCYLGRFQYSLVPGVTSFEHFHKVQHPVFGKGLLDAPTIRMLDIRVAYIEKGMHKLMYEYDSCHLGHKAR